MGFGYQEIGFGYQEILLGISRGLRKWTRLVVICHDFKQKLIEIWHSSWNSFLWRWGILQNSKISFFQKKKTYCFIQVHIPFCTMRITSRPLPGICTWKILATRKLKNSTPMTEITFLRRRMAFFWWKRLSETPHLKKVSFGLLRHEEILRKFPRLRPPGGVWEVRLIFFELLCYISFRYN